MLSQLNLGNGSIETYTYNDRFQMTSQSLLKGTQVLQKFDYGFGTTDLATGTVDATKNNGQLGKIESTIGTVKQWSQRFGYDSLGRLSESREYKSGVNTTLSYKQKFDYDRFGNMYRKAASNPTTGQLNPLPYTAIEDADIDKSKNRFATGTTYDDAGAVVSDNKFRAMNFAYDANGRMVKASKTNTPDAWTVFDALGNRVATKINDVWQFVIYDAFGKLVAEYGMAGEGRGGVNWVLQDWQGSVRASVNSNGFISARFDFTAFGEKISLGIGLRSIDQGYSAPQNSRQGYGLTETDSATGLDHTWFRKNENRAGRWTSPDPYKGSMSLGSSGSFNRYSYVENQPTNFLDPSGLLMIIFWNCVPGGVEQPGFCYIDYIWYIPEGTGGGGGTRGGGGGGGGEGIPADAWKYATNAAPQPAPRNSNFSALRNGATVVAGAGAAYAGYRIIRLLPSLAPPLWPTIPVNLAVP